MNKKILGPFAIQLLFLLPSLFFVWYQAGPWVAPLLAKLLEPLLHGIWPNAIQAVKPMGAKLVVIAQLQHPITHGDFAGHFIYSDKGILISPYTYAFGAPLYAALAIASTASFKQHVLRFSLGMILLLAGVGITVVTSLLYIFQLDSGYPQLHWFASRELNDTLVRYCHYIGFQLVPRVLPLMLWALLYRETLRELLGLAPSGKNGGGPVTTPSGKASGG